MPKPPRQSPRQPNVPTTCSDLPVKDLRRTSGEVTPHSPEALGPQKELSALLEFSRTVAPGPIPTCELDTASSIRALLLDSITHLNSPSRLEFHNKSYEEFEDVLALVDSDIKLRGWRVEFLNGTIITMPYPAHELLETFWGMVSGDMVESGWLSKKERYNIHVHQANITLADPPGDSLRPDLCIVPNRIDHFPTILFESALTQTYENVLEKVEAWFKGSMGRIGFVVIIDFKYPKEIEFKPDCTVELWTHKGKEAGFAPELVCGPKTVYPVPDDTALDEPIAFSFTYEQFFGPESVPDIYIPDKDVQFSWPMEYLRHAVSIALRSHKKEITFKKEMINLKRKRLEAKEEEKGLGRRHYRRARDGSPSTPENPQKTDDTGKDNRDTSENKEGCPPKLPAQSNTDNSAGTLQSADPSLTGVL